MVRQVPVHFFVLLHIRLEGEKYCLSMEETLIIIRVLSNKNHKISFFKY